MILPAELDRLVPPRIAASLLGVSQKSITLWADAGDLPCIRTHANHRRFKLSDILEMRDAMVVRGAINTA